MRALKTYQSKQQTGTEGYLYETEAYISSASTLLADSWTVNGVFCTSTTTTNKSATSSKKNDCSISSFKSGTSGYISGQFTAQEKSTAFGNVKLTLNVVY